jgi:hypothetical protein
MPNTGQLEDLMKTLQQTTPYFVRCVKPNSEKKPLFFDENVGPPCFSFQGDAFY